MGGGAVVGLNTAARARDLANWIRHSESSWLIASRRHGELAVIQDILGSAPVHYLLIDENAQDGWHAIDGHSMPPESRMDFRPETQLASLIYTSGTTGQPKGVMLSHRNLLANVESILSYLKLDENDSVLNVLPFYYSYGNSVMHTHLAAGATLFLENSMLYPQRVVSLMEQCRVTGFSGVPSTFTLLLRRTKLSEFDLSSLRYLTQAGGAMTPANIERVKRELPNVDFFVMYGQTEASARLSYLPPDQLENKAGSIGIAIPGVELKVMDEHFRPAAINSTGEIYARGENIMLGYWKDPQASQQVFHDGWLKTGDLAYMDDDGYLFIVGRSSEMIKSGAHRISPRDIEEVILELEGVEEVAVVGVDDELLGQAVKAVIVTSPGYNIDKKQVMHHCKTSLANYKLPKYVDFADDIPRTASGKVRRFMLQK
jgi:acyl-CoA synthetase (AMP-forming)/AMP-acid ligase II